MLKENVIYVVTISVDLDTNGAYYAYCPGIKGVHVSGHSKGEAIEEALKSAINMLQIYSDKGKAMPENEHFYLLTEPKHSYELAEDDVLMPIPAHIANVFANCEQGLQA